MAPIVALPDDSAFRHLSRPSRQGFLDFYCHAVLFRVLVLRECSGPPARRASGGSRTGGGLSDETSVNSKTSASASMKYFKAKSSDARDAASKSKRKAGQEAAAAQGDDDQPQCSAPGTAASAKWQQDKAKDPYRRQRIPLWKRGKAPAATATTKEDKPSRRQDAEQGNAATEAAEAVEEVVSVNAEQQTSDTELNLDEPLEEYTVKYTPSDEATASTSGLSVRPPIAEEEDDDSDTDDSASASATASGIAPSMATPSLSIPDSEASARLSGELSALTSLMGMSSGTALGAGTAGTSKAAPNADSNAAAEDDGEGVRAWQRGILGRLTRARQRRDIRLNRKEVLSMQVVLEAVLKQYMALSREIESVKANLQWESVEPVSLSRALSRLQTERREESAALAKMLACKDKEVHSLQANVGNLRAATNTLQQQVSILEQSCREKDVDLKKAANALAQLYATHKATIHEQQRRHDEAMAEAVKAKDALQRQVEAQCVAHAAALAEANARQQAETAAHQQAVDALLATKQLEHEECLAELRAELSTVRTDAAASESRYEMESMRLSRALTEKEAHLGRLLATVEQLNSTHDGELKALRAELRDHERALRAARTDAQTRGDALAARDAELVALRAEQETVMVMVSKALSLRDNDSQHLRDAMESMRKDYERQQQSLRNATDILQSQRDVEALSYSQTINEKDLRISDLMIELQNNSAALQDAQHRLQLALEGQQRADEAHAVLLKTVEAMNGQQEDLTHRLNVAYSQMHALDAERADLMATHQAEMARMHGVLAEHQQNTNLEIERLRRDLQQGGTEADGLRRALKDLQQSSGAQIANLQKALKDSHKGGAEADSLRKALDEQRHASAAAADELRREMQTLHDGHLAELQRLQAALDDARRKHKADGDHFRGALHEKDVQIRDLTDRFVNYRRQEEEARCELEARNEGLLAEAQAHEKEIAVLKNSVSQMRNSHRERKAELDKKAAEATELHNALLKHKQVVEEARAECRELQERGRQADRARAQHEAELAKLKQAVEEKDEQINDMVRERALLQTERDSLRADTDHYTKQRENFQVVLEEKEREVRALRDKLARLQARVDSDRAELVKGAADAAEESERLRAERDAAVEQREALVAKFSKLFKVVRRSFDRRTSERAALEQSLAESRAAAAVAQDKLDSALQSHQAEKDKVMKMMLGKDNDMKQLRENLHQYEDHLRSTKEEMDATVAVLKRKLQRRDAELQRRDVELQRRDADLQRLEAEAQQLQQAQQAALERAAALESVVQDGQKRIGELELELDLGRTVLKKNTEDCRVRVEKLQQQVENVRQERNAEMTLLKDSMMRLEDELITRDRQMELAKAENGRQMALLQRALSDRQDDTERLTDTVERLQRENDALHAKEEELRRAMEYLKDENVEDAIREKDSRIAALEEEHRRMAEALQEAVRRDGEAQRLMAEALQQAARDREQQIATLQDAARRKDQQIVDLEEAVNALKAGLDLDVLKLKDMLSDCENEKLQLSARASMLEAQLEDQVSLMARQIADRDDEIRALTDAKAGFEKANSDLAEENVQLLNVMHRMQKERQDEMQHTVRTTHSALRANEGRLDRLRDEAAEAEALRKRAELAEAELQRLRDEVQRVDFLEKQRAADRQKEADEAAVAKAASEAAERDNAKKEAELKVLNLTAEALKQELRALQARSEEGDGASLEKQLRSREMEVDKLKQTVEALRTDLTIQKQLLLTFHEGRAYLGAPSEHDALSRTARVLRDLHNTAELTALPQDGDHRSAVRPYPHRRPMFELKRTASEGDHLDIDEMCGLNLLSGVTTPSSITVSSRTMSQLSTTSNSRPPPPPASTLML
ncbi:myosin-1B-like [Thrips palmi]|uniref:Myosin-1B-like n=1 Tax=Thrips palmi TaxID=161013 RepID=A0A6P8Y3P2_THRPL|nr:myosin-1B-like [Thrips palmi]